MDDDLDYLDEDLILDEGVGATNSGDGGWFGPWEAGIAYALVGHLFDRHAEKVTAGREDIHVHVRPQDEDDPPPKLINAAEGKQSPQWDMYFGQEPLKEQLRVHIASAKERDAALDHVLLASGMPGVGKTTMARIVADEMGGEFVMLVPPFHVTTLIEAARKLPNKGVLFIDEVHKLADHGKAAAENLLHMLEERRLYLDEGIVELADITVIGATTDADKLPETVIDRFPIKPYFQPYSIIELAEITASFEGKEGVELPLEVTLAIAQACRGTPRVARELVVAARDLFHAHGRHPTPQELLQFKETDPDGMTRQHKAYIKAIYKHFERTTADGQTVFIAGEYAMRSILRETRDGLYRLERFLMERGFIDRSPQGRRLTAKGIQAARHYITEDLGRVDAA